MTKEKRSLFVRFLIGFVILVGLDQWTKGLASAYLKGNSLWYSSGVYLNFIIQKTEELLLVCSRRSSCSFS